MYATIAFLLCSIVIVYHYSVILQCTVGVTLVQAMPLVPPHHFDNRKK